METLDEAQREEAMNIFRRLFGRNESGAKYVILIVWKRGEKPDRYFRKSGLTASIEEAWLTTSIEEAKKQKRDLEERGRGNCKYKIVRWNEPTSIPETARIPDRLTAKRLSDEGVSCAMRGNHEEARRKWLAAAKWDPTWSVPNFNLAKSYIDQKDFEAAGRHLSAAESRARNGSGSEDSDVLEQVSTIRARITIQSELQSRAQRDSRR